MSEISEGLQSILSVIFEDIGIELYAFNISGIRVPDEQYAFIRAGKAKLAARKNDMEIMKANAGRQVKEITALGDANAEVMAGKAHAASREAQGYTWASGDCI